MVPPAGREQISSLGDCLEDSVLNIEFLDVSQIPSLVVHQVSLAAVNYQGLFALSLVLEHYMRKSPFYHISVLGDLLKLLPYRAESLTHIYRVIRSPSKEIKQLLSFRVNDLKIFPSFEVLIVGASVVEHDYLGFDGGI